MKVLVLHSELGVLRGGGENFSRNLFCSFAERGHQVSAAFVADHKGNYPIPLPACIVPIPIAGWWSRKLGQSTLSRIGRSIPSESSLARGWERFQEALNWRSCRWHESRFQSRVQRHFAERWSKFDAVYVHGDAVLAARVARHRPTVLRLPGPVTSELEPCLRSVHAVCANGDALVRIREFLSDHVTELPMGLDERIFVPGPTNFRSVLSWNEQDFVVGYVGRLTRLKGIDLLAAAFRELCKSTFPAKLLIVGHGEEEGNIREALRGLIACGRVHIESGADREDMPRWYRSMDLLVMPSRYENCSNAIVEAIACGIPVLASDVGGNRLLVRDFGWYFDVKSISSLIAGLRSAFTNRAEAGVRGSRGSFWIRGRYNWATSAERLETLLKTQLGVGAE